METFLHWLSVWFIGVMLAAPIGPVSILFIRRTLQLGIQGAAAVGIGNAVADLIYIIIFVTGFSIVPADNVWVKCLGGLFLLGIAVYEIIKNKNEKIIKNERKRGWNRVFIHSFFLTLVNPMNIMIFLSIFASVDIDISSINEFIWVIFTIILGPISWWLALGILIIKVHKKISEVWWKRAIYASFFVIGSLGVIAIIESVMEVWK